MITCSSLLTPSCQGVSRAEDRGTGKERDPGLGMPASWGAEARSACLPGAQWPVRGPERTGSHSPLPGTLQEACSCREESMAPGPCFMPPAGCRVGRGVQRPPPALRAARSPPKPCPNGAPCPLGRGWSVKGGHPPWASPGRALVPLPLAASWAAGSSPRDTQEPITGRRGRATAPGVRRAAARSCLRGPGLLGSASASAWVVVPAAASRSPRAAPAAARTRRRRGGRGTRGERRAVLGCAPPPPSPCTCCRCPG